MTSKQNVEFSNVKRDQAHVAKRRAVIPGRRDRWDSSSTSAVFSIRVDKDQQHDAMVGHTRVEKMEENVIRIRFLFLSTAGYVYFSCILPICASEHFFPVTSTDWNQRTNRCRNPQQDRKSPNQRQHDMPPPFKSLGCFDCIPQSEGVLDKQTSTATITTSKTLIKLNSARGTCRPSAVS